MNCRAVIRLVSCLAAAGIIAGCEQSPGTPKHEADKPTTISTDADLHAALKAKNPGYNGQGKLIKAGPSIVGVDLAGTNVVDLSPLNGLTLREVTFASNPGLSDLSPLKGMKLESAEFNDTAVSDLSPLSGMPLQMLYLVNTQVASLEPLRGSRVEQLWLSNAPVTDLGPLADLPLVSLTIENTRVADLGFVSRLRSLQRLHIAGTDITDLTPLAGLPLTRLIFTPAKITRGMEAARTLPNCTEIGVTFDQMMRPEEFWRLYDAGGIR